MLWLTIWLAGGIAGYLWDGLANGIILGFFLIQIFAYGFRPYDEVRYKGAYSNCNVNSLMYLMPKILADSKDSML